MAQAKPKQGRTQQDNRKEAPMTSALDTIVEEQRTEEKGKRRSAIADALKRSKEKQKAKKAGRAEALKHGATMTRSETKRMAAQTNGKATTAKSAAAPDRTGEEALRQRYPHVIKGSLGFDKAHNKQTCSISCVECKGKRDVFTSDLFQVKRCQDCTAEARAKARAASRAKASGKTTKKAKTSKKSK